MGQQVTTTTGERPGWLDDGLYPFASSWLRVPTDSGDAVVHHVDEGDGPPIVLYHGNPTWSFLYRRMIPRLAEHFRVIAMDLPGFGLSSAPDGYGFLPAEHAKVAKAVVEHLDLDGYIPFVQDWGGPIGLWAAGQHPDRVRGLGIGNTWAWPNDAIAARAFAALMGGPLMKLPIERANAFVNLLIPAATRQTKLSQAEMDHFRSPLDTRRRRHASWVFPREITKSRDFLLEVRAGLDALIDKPALLTWGMKDFAFPPPVRAQWSRLLSDAVSIDLPEAGHYIQQEAPDAIVDAILERFGAG